jgi:hypothetical protein
MQFDVAAVCGKVVQFAAPVFAGQAPEAVRKQREQLRTLMGWESDPAPEELGARVEESLRAHPELLPMVARLVSENFGTLAGLASSLWPTGRVNIPTAPPPERPGR